MSSPISITRRTPAWASLDPDSTTPALTDREFMTGVKENHSWSGGSMLETGFAWLDVYHRATPRETALPHHAGGPLRQLFPNVHPDRPARPDLREFLSPGLAPPGPPPVADRRRCPAPGLRAANFQRTGFEILGLDGLPVSETTFPGSGIFERPNTALSGYLNDHWQPLGNLIMSMPACAWIGTSWCGRPRFRRASPLPGRRGKKAAPSSPPVTPSSTKPPAWRCSAARSISSPSPSPTPMACPVRRW